MLSDGDAAAVVISAPLPPAEPEERQVAITQELAPLEPVPDPPPRRQRGPQQEPADPARLAELRERIAAGTYDAAAELREMVEQRGLAAMREQAR